MTSSWNTRNLPAATEATPDGPQGPNVWPMTITRLAAGTAKKSEEQPAVKKTASPRFLPPQEPRPTQVRMLFKRARLVGGCPGAEREKVHPRCFPPLYSTPALLFKRGPLAQTVCPKPEENPGDLKGVPSIGVEDSNVCGVEVRAENRKACARFLTPLEPRRARIWKRARLAQGLPSQPKDSTGASSGFSMPVPSTGCLCNFRCVCGVGFKAGAEEKVAPLLSMPPLEPRPAKLFKLGLLAEGVRKAETSGGFEKLGVGGSGCVCVSSNTPSCRPPSASFTLKDEKHWGTPTRGRRITSSGLLRA